MKKSYTCCFLLLPLCAVLMTACRAPIQSTTESSPQKAPICRAVARLNLTDLSTPVYREDIGSSSLTIATQSAAAQRWFNQGLNLLHGFWHIEAYRAFREVIKADSSCAMGYWGIAMCQPGFASEDPTEWRNAIQQATSRQNTCSTLEKGLIEATNHLIYSGPDAALTSFSALTKQFPNEPEIIAFTAITMRQANVDLNGLAGQSLQQLLQRGMTQFPNHVGLLHYYVHFMELRPDFAKAQPAAQKMVKLAPNVPHLTHMPGHLQYLAGNYDQAIAAYQQARIQEEKYHQSEAIPYDADQNYLHNLHFLAVAEAEANHYEKALEAAQQFANTTLTTQATDGSSLMILYEGRILPALVHIRFRQWQKATDYLSSWLNKADQPISDNLVRIYLQVMQHYCQGMQAAEQGSLSNSQQHLTQLQNLLQRYNTEGAPMQGRMAFKPINETYDIMDMARLELQGWIINADPTRPFDSRAFLEALDLENAIRYDEPPRLMYPIAESWGRLHLRRNEKTQARMVFTEALKKRPLSPIIQQLAKLN